MHGQLDQNVGAASPSKDFVG